MLYVTSEGRIVHIFGDDGLLTRHRHADIFCTLCPHSCVGKKCILNWECTEKNKLFKKYLAEINNKTGL